MATLDLTGPDHILRMPTSTGGRDPRSLFAARFDYRYQGLAVVCKETSPGTWSITTYPGVATTQVGGDTVDVETDLTGADYVFYGGSNHTVSDAGLITALGVAGYTI